MNVVGSNLSKRLLEAPQWVFSSWCIVAAFGTYFDWAPVGGTARHVTAVVVAVVFINLVHKIWGEQAPTYLAVEKPLAVLERLAGWDVIGFKLLLIASQVAGYTLSKFLGIKFVSEMPASRRAVTILLLIGWAELALLLFALAPMPVKPLMLFLNGLPLGMVFGLVLAFLEGRRATEALTAGLCASFIVASGVVKSVGKSLIDGASRSS